PALWVTEMFTTAGDTFLTSGAKLSCCISAIGEVIVPGAAFPTGGGLLVPAGFSAHTRGESASVAPSPKPSAAARLLRSQGRRSLSSLTSTNWSSCHTGDARRAANCDPREQIARQLGVPGDRRLS